MKLSAGRKTQYLTKRKKKWQNRAAISDQNWTESNYYRSLLQFHPPLQQDGEEREILGKKKKPMPPNKTLPQELIMEHKIA